MDFAFVAAPTLVRAKPFHLLSPVSYTHLDVYKRQGMYTANSMNCLCEAIGIALPGNGTIPAVYSKRLQLAKHAGMAIMDMVKKGITARQIINERSIRNALTCDMALGCSTNTVLHLSLIHILKSP